ncbi:MAG: glycosyltransferase family 9 protein [Candidatus Omnitrophica bacterium]|nr:glycosyltransferase family 9 protein [Candidatus Omnitrophota bacterium]
MKKVLIANIFGIGDVLFTVPLVSNLKKRFGNAVVDYVANKRTAPVLRSIPDIGYVHVYEKDEFVDLWKRSKRLFGDKVLSFFGRIKLSNYDVVLDMTFSRKFGLLFMLAGIGERVGLDYRGRGVFLTKKKKIEGFEDKHVVEYYLDLLGLMNVPATVREARIRRTTRRSERKTARTFLVLRAPSTRKAAAKDNQAPLDFVINRHNE